MLTRCVRTREHVPEYHMLEVVNTALSEYFWYGKNIFEDRRRLFVNILEEAGLLKIAPSYYVVPTWKDLYERYIKANRTARF